MSSTLKFPFRGHNKDNSFAKSTHGGPQIIAMGGGKGGVGKSFVSVNLAISLARHDSVTLVDLDLGGANAHTCLGTLNTNLSVSDFLKGRVKNLSDLCLGTQVRNLNLISGANDALDIANMNEQEVQTVLNAIRNLNCKYVILDLGAGTSQHTLDFFIAADVPVLTVSPEPTSVENTYRFLKAAFYRKLQQIPMDDELRRIINQAMDLRNSLGIRSPADLMNFVVHSYPEAGQQIRQELSAMHFNFVLNQVRTAQDLQIGQGLASVSKKYFGVDTNFLGHISYDDAVWQLLRRKTPVLLGQPYSNTSNQIAAIAKKLLAPSQEKAVI